MKYILYAYHLDGANNIESTKTCTFVYDQTPPDSYLGEPNASFESDTSLSKIWGTAVDHPDSPKWNAGVGAVQVLISSGTGSGIYWDGDSFEIMSRDAAWQDANLWLSSWTYTALTVGNLSEGMTYIVNSRAKDKTTNKNSTPNVEVTITTQTFVYDTIEPESWMTMPDEAQTYETMSAISGTAQDTSPGALDYVVIRIRQTGGGTKLNQYWDWDDSEWTATPAQPWSDPINPSGSNWSITTSGVTWEADASGVNYRTWFKAYDEAGNEEAEDYNDWVFTSPFPTTRVTDPTGISANPDYYYQPTQVQGTADQYTSIDEVYVLISSGPGYSKYWNNITETWESSAQIQINATGNPFPDANPWTATVSTEAWTDGVKYNVQSKGQGPAGWETPASGAFFYIDRTLPESEAQSPADEAHHKSISQITGTSWDVSPGKVGSVQLKIQRGGSYYTGYSWTGSEQWISASAVDGTFDETAEDWKWDVTYPTEAWKTDGAYTVEAKARDKTKPNANTESAFLVNDFYIDNTTPLSWMITPTTYTYHYNSLSQIKGTGEDQGTVEGWNNILLRIKNIDTTRYWKKDTGWDVAETWLDLTDTDQNKGYMSIFTDSWTYTGVEWQSGYEYKLVIWAKDKAGNVETSSHTASILFDDKKPLSNGTEPKEGGYYNALAEIKGTAVDYSAAQQRVSDVKGVQVAYKKVTEGYWNQADWSGGSHQWIEAVYAKATDIWVEDNENPFDNPSLPADGEYQAILKAYDEAGNYQTTYTTVTFTWDRTAPSFYSISPGTGAYINSMTAKLRLGEKMKQDYTRIIYEAKSAYNGEVNTSTDTYVILTQEQCDDLADQTIPAGQFEDALIDGNKYTLQVIGQDLAGNHCLAYLCFHHNHCLHYHRLHYFLDT